MASAGGATDASASVKVGRGGGYTGSLTKHDEPLLVPHRRNKSSDICFRAALACQLIYIYPTLAGLAIRRAGLMLLDITDETACRGHLLRLATRQKHVGTTTTGNSAMLQARGLVGELERNHRPGATAARWLQGDRSQEP